MWVVPGNVRRRARKAVKLTTSGTAALSIMIGASPALAQSWVVRSQAIGQAADGSYSYCGSSDGQVNCSNVSGNASGSVTYSNGNTRIAAQGQAQGSTNPSAVASGQVAADLSSASIRQSNSNFEGQSQTSGTLADTLTFVLPDASTVYEIPFAYRFDGSLTGDTVGEFHPGLYAQSYLGLGSGSIGSTQSIGESGPDYFAPTVGLSNGAGQWINTVVTDSMFGYSITGDVLIGGGWGNSLAFNMNSQVSCANEYGSATCDYSHTQAFDFGSLPTGVSYSSASGVFLTSALIPAVPEPATWLLMIAGFGLIAFRLRAGRQIAFA